MLSTGGRNICVCVCVRVCAGESASVCANVNVCMCVSVWYLASQICADVTEFVKVVHLAVLPRLCSPAPGAAVPISAVPSIGVHDFPNLSLKNYLFKELEHPCGRNRAVAIIIQIAKGLHNYQS